jgi:predicted DNA-binding transcriptional regulator AlpA
MSGSSTAYFTSTDLAARYQRVQRTLVRWEKNPPQNFPQPLRVNGRKLWPQEAIENWERSLASKVTEAV